MNDVDDTPPDEGSTPLHAVRAQAGDAALGRALALVRLLRERCPWDARQTPQSLRPYVLEEAHEVAEAIEAGDDGGLRDELGDLLLNVAFQIVLAEERGAFDAESVVEALESKMEARHPHVYGDAASPPDWEAMKARERAGDGDAGRDGDPFAGVAGGLDPLSRAARVQERMAGLGFDWDDLAGPLAKVREEAEELALVATADAGTRIGDASSAVEREAGDLLFAAVNAARRAGAHPANALQTAVRTFERRCRLMLAIARERGIDAASADLETLDAIWDEVKAGE